MLRNVTYVLTIFLVLSWGVGFAFAGDQDRIRDRKKDGTCEKYIEETGASIFLAGENGKGSGDRDRDRDDSCDG